MFYSEQLLTKTGPLARVWLASNVERKLTKDQVLKSDISTSVHLISDTGSAPMALRMSGQLMLGVVRIYRRKAGYLLEDSATELKRFVESQQNQYNNNDMINTTTTSTDLNLPATLTIDDLFPALDFGFPLTQLPATQDNDRALAYDEDWTSSLDPKTQEDESAVEAEAPARIRDVDDDDDLGLDLGEDVPLEDTTVSLQIGRGERTPRPDDETIMPAYDEPEDDLGLDLGEDVPMPDLSVRAQDQPVQGLEEQEPQIRLDDETAQLEEAISREGSPLSEADPEFMQDMDRTFQQLQEEDIEVVAQQRQVSRRQKPMVMDRDTVLSRGAIKAFSEDRSKILKPASFLPQDPELLALMIMQKNGDFVTNAMNDGLASGWAPEIQGLLSFDAVYRSGRKRKRDSGIADIASEDEHSDKSPRLDRSSHQVEEDEGVEVGGPSPGRPTSEIPEAHVPVDTDDPALADVVPGEDDEGIYTAGGDFDETTAPLVAPEDSGPISLSTQHAVHRLREIFGGSPDADSPSSQSRKSVLLQELIPESRTSREDATKLFFETLVLATKDAIKVEQSDREVGLPIRIRAKRGLWGQWAEPTQSGETATQEVGVSA